MATKTILDSTLTAIANAIRAKTGKSATMTPLEMPDEIESISGGGGSDENFKKALEGDITNDVTQCVTEVVLPSGLSRVRTAAFYKGRFKKITWPSDVTAIADETFRECRIKDGVVFTGPITDIAQNAFYSTIFDNIDFVVPGSNAQHRAYSYINGNAFYAVSGLHSITLGSPDYGYKFSGNSCFRNAGATLKEATVYIYDTNNYFSGIFDGCSGLEKIKLALTTNYASANPQGISQNCFRNCSNCLVYDFTGWPIVPTLASTNAFTNINANAKIVVPDALYNDWVAATNWSTYASYIIKESDYAA